MHEQNNAETVTKMHIFSCCLPKAFIYFIIIIIIIFFVLRGQIGQQNTSKVIYPFVSSGNFEKEITSSGLGYKILASLAVVSRKLYLFAKQAGQQNTSTLIYPCVSSQDFRESNTEITSSRLDCKILARLGVVFRKLFFLRSRLVSNVHQH